MLAKCTGTSQQQQQSLSVLFVGRSRYGSVFTSSPRKVANKFDGLFSINNTPNLVSFFLKIRSS